MHLRAGKKILLKEYETASLAEDLNAFFDSMVDVDRIKPWQKQTIDTLSSEEALLFAKYLRRKPTFILSISRSLIGAALSQNRHITTQLPTREAIICSRRESLGIR